MTGQRHVVWAPSWREPTGRSKLGIRTSTLNRSQRPHTSPTGSFVYGCLAKKVRTRAQHRYNSIPKWRISGENARSYRRSRLVAQLASKYLFQWYFISCALCSSRFFSQKEKSEMRWIKATLSPMHIFGTDLLRLPTVTFTFSRASSWARNGPLARFRCREAQLWLLPQSRRSAARRLLQWLFLDSRNPPSCYQLSFHTPSGRRPRSRLWAIWVQRTRQPIWHRWYALCLTTM